MEVAVNVPFDCAEIREIAGAEFQKRLTQLSPIQGMKEYVRFELDFNVKIKVWQAGGIGSGKETLAWGHVERKDPSAADLDAVAEEAEIANSTFVSKDPNEERMSREMPLTIETTDGKGGKTRRKARIKE